MASGSWFPSSFPRLWASVGSWTFARRLQLRGQPRFHTAFRFKSLAGTLRVAGIILDTGDGSTPDGKGYRHVHARPSASQADERTRPVHNVFDSVNRTARGSTARARGARVALVISTKETGISQRSCRCVSLQSGASMAALSRKTPLLANGFAVSRLPPQ
jgi:hypothetical protein